MTETLTRALDFTPGQAWDDEENAMADRVLLALMARTGQDFPPSRIARMAKVDSSAIYTLLAALVAEGLLAVNGNGSRRRYEYVARPAATREELVALATDNPEVRAAAARERFAAVPPAQSTTIRPGAPVTVRAEAERTPCTTQDTVAAALVPGDVVLGPDGWVIVAALMNNDAFEQVRVVPEPGRAPSFVRAWTDVVTVQPDADTTSSASRQSFIETGRYLRRELAPRPSTLHVLVDGAWQPLADADLTPPRCPDLDAIDDHGGNPEWFDGQSYQRA